MTSLRERLKRDEVVLGTWSIVADATLVEIAAMAGLDFLILDLEHGAYDFGSLEQAIRAAEGAGAAPLVRVPDLTPATFQRVLDLGAHGVIIPRIGNVADAEQAVRCAKYPPRGIRGYNPFTRAANYAAPSTLGSGKLAPDFGVIAIIIETLEAYRDLDAICAIADVDVIYLGVYDMALALGCGGDTGHPRVGDFVADASRRVRAARKSLGLMVRDEASLDAAVDSGTRLIVWGVDSNVAYQAFRRPVEHLRRSRGVAGEQG